jgi:hypothetical protein
MILRARKRLMVIAPALMQGPMRSPRSPTVRQLDLAYPAAEKIVLVLEGIGDDKVRVNSSSLDHPLVVLPDQALEIVGIAKKVMVGRALPTAPHYRVRAVAKTRNVRVGAGYAAPETRAALDQARSHELLFHRC